MKLIHCHIIDSIEGQAIAVVQLGPRRGGRTILVRDRYGWSAAAKGWDSTGCSHSFRARVCDPEMARLAEDAYLSLSEPYRTAQELTGQ